MQDGGKTEETEDRLDDGWDSEKHTWNSRGNVTQSVISSYSRWFRAVGGGFQSLIISRYSPTQENYPRPMFTRQIAVWVPFLGCSWPHFTLTPCSTLLFWTVHPLSHLPSLHPTSCFCPWIVCKSNPPHQPLACDFSPPSWLLLLRLTPTRTLTLESGQTWRGWPSG